MIKKGKVAAALLCAFTIALTGAGCGSGNYDSYVVGGPETSGVDLEGEDTETESSEGTEQEAQTVETTGLAPAVCVTRYYDADSNIQVDGFLVVSDGADALNAALREENVRVKEAALSNRDAISGDPSWYCENTGIVRRCDATVFSCTRENYVYVGMSDSRPYTTGYTYDVQTGQKLELSDVITDKNAFIDAAVQALGESSDSVVYIDAWEPRSEEILESGTDFTWYLSDDCFHLIMANDTIMMMGEEEVQIPYEECGAFLDARYIPSGDMICHLVDDYGETCREYCFDANGDGAEEVLQIDLDYHYSDDLGDNCLTPIISFGRGYDSLITVYGEESFELLNSWVIESDYGKIFLYVETMGYDDYHTLSIYDVTDPDAGPVYMGTNESGAFYDFINYDPEQLYVESMVYTMGSYMGYTVCTIRDDGQLVTPDETEYRIMCFDDGPAFNPEQAYDGTTTCLTLKQDLTTYVYDIATGDGSDQTLTAGTLLYPYLSQNYTYMVFRLEDGQYVTLYYDDSEDDLTMPTIGGIPESDLLDGIIYAS